MKIPYNRSLSEIDTTWEGRMEGTSREVKEKCPSFSLVQFPKIKGKKWLFTFLIVKKSYINLWIKNSKSVM